MIDRVRTAMSLPCRTGVSRRLWIVLLIFLSLPAHGGVAGTRHDLSTNNADSNQPCAFCHTPHTSNMGPVYAPLWNRFVDLNQTYTVYSSATMNTLPGNPGMTRSVLCLGCHDGTIGTSIVNGITGSTKHDLVNAPGPGGSPDLTSYPNCERCHTMMYYGRPAKWQGTDLSNDHPIAMTYPTSVQDPAFNTPPDLAQGWPDVPLFGGRVECASCHDPHDDSLTSFLRRSNAGSALCLTCHTK